MKRIAIPALFALCLAPSLVQAFPFFPFPRVLSTPPQTDMEAERVNLPSHPAAGPRLGMDGVLAIFDDRIVADFREAWHRAGCGSLPYESVVLILKMKDGSFSAQMPGMTHQYKRFTFTWHPATVAIVHTHPNGSSSFPEGDDLETADKYKVPVFTITSRGMYVYDPLTRKTSKVFDGLSWLEDGTWQKFHAQLASRAM